MFFGTWPYFQFAKNCEICETSMTERERDTYKRKENQKDKYFGLTRNKIT